MGGQDRFDQVPGLTQVYSGRSKCQGGFPCNGPLAAWAETFQWDWDSSWEDFCKYLGCDPIDLVDYES